MQNSKWGVVNSTEPIYVVLFVSRNKDNKGVEGFKERRVSFLATYEEYNTGRLRRKFESFVDGGVPGEFCRFYMSQNSRHAPTVYKELLKFLIDNPDFNLCSIQAKLAGIAAQHKCAAEKKWFFDFDSMSFEKIREFFNDVSKYIDEEDIRVGSTPHGFAVEVKHGFDTREIMAKWSSIATLKKDDLICISWRTTKGECHGGNKIL